MALHRLPRTLNSHQRTEKHYSLYIVFIIALSLFSTSTKLFYPKANSKVLLGFYWVIQGIKSTQKNPSLQQHSILCQEDLQTWA